MARAQDTAISMLQELLDKMRSENKVSKKNLPKLQNREFMIIIIVHLYRNK